MSKWIDYIIVGGEVPELDLPEVPEPIIETKKPLDSLLDRLETADEYNSRREEQVGLYE